MTPIVELIRDIVEEMEVNFYHGHPLEIINLLQAGTRDEQEKGSLYPAICLFQDFPETHQADTLSREATLNIVLITDTDPTFEAPQRYENTFKPILIPLYEEFRKQLERSFQIKGDYKYTEHLYWGKSGLYGNVNNIFNDFVDAIELENLTIKVELNCD